MITVDADVVRELAGWVNSRVAMGGVQVVELHARAHRFGVQGTLHVDVQPEARASQQSEHVIVNARYQVTAQVAETDDDEDDTLSGDDEPVWEVRAELAAVFHVHDETQSAQAHFNDAQLSAFALSTGILAIHPYARELVQDSVMRLGYPPYAMDLMRPAWNFDREEKFEIDGELEDL